MKMERTTAGFGLLAALAVTLVPGSTQAETTTVFLQYDEQELVAGDEDNAATGQSWTLQWFEIDSVTIPAVQWERGQSRDRLTAAVQQILAVQWEGIDIEFVTERPDHDDYRMVTMGGYGGSIDLPFAGGWGTLDCYDENKTSIAFVFSEQLRGIDGLLSADMLAHVISQEVAHTVGLEHLADEQQFIMYPATSNATGHYFSTECEEITGAIMDPRHPEYCLDHPGCEEGYQNDMAHLLAFLGPAVPGGDDTGGSEGGSESGDGGSMGQTTSTGGDSDDGGNTGEPGLTGTTEAEATTGSGDGPQHESSGSGGQQGSEEGCSCRSGLPSGSALAWGLFPVMFGLARRRR